VGYAVCRHKPHFRNWLISEFPIRWGTQAEAIVYPNKGDAERIKQRIGGRTAVIDLGSERAPPRPPS
jgi:hypothetical protein